MLFTSGDNWEWRRTFVNVNGTATRYFLPSAKLKVLSLILLKKIGNKQKLKILNSSVSEVPTKKWQVIYLKILSWIRKHVTKNIDKWMPFRCEQREVFRLNAPKKGFRNIIAIFYHFYEFSSFHLKTPTDIYLY